MSDVVVALDMSAEVDAYEELKGHPGAYLPLISLDPKTGRRTRLLVACCPGCGQTVATLVGPKYPIGGSDEAPSCATGVRWACCDWFGGLLGGLWNPYDAPQSLHRSA